jgi:hypothetical protein
MVTISRDLVYMDRAGKDAVVVSDENYAAIFMVEMK